MHVLFECKYEDHMMSKWMRVGDGLDEKERAMFVIKTYVEVNDEVVRERERE